MAKLQNEQLGALQRKLNGIIKKIEDGGLDYQRALNGLQAVNDGRGFVRPDSSEQKMIIRPNRTTSPVYPDWKEELLHPELELTGPARYNISQVEQWLHDGQKRDKWVKGQVIYEYLKDNQMLNSCLSLADLLAIQAKGINFFRQHHKGKAIFGWKSVVRRRDGHLYVPCLCEDGGEVVLDWYWLGGDWYDSDPALRLAS
ncbi:MAG: hypothetical protein COV33_01205 [Candidatus Zambryskibacteria bacterium CG10_big_fil_rev_8_21_14_0_10_34_34]|uniref:Uncharacterized protein n=1 Tax=Candidatus Zambryskibacteria bacterium CG10_big_fil_rev_8_21_14_0_10_34_34 TaxID=1975114 RepID=A0A2H0R0Y6_9BACT|nr:MAG: hypothetical protein COV33_01205 [Candidatus Zambryskibacteria bacterium CG10_big_fil_rev_8_21_14_0_10_34_34]